MAQHLSPGASGANRRFAGWVARGSVGVPSQSGPSAVGGDDECRDVLAEL